MRWAYDDPNPTATEAATRADADAVVNMLTHRGVALAPEASQLPAPPPAYGEDGLPLPSSITLTQPPALPTDVIGDGPAAVSSEKGLFQEITTMRPDNYCMPAAKRLRVDEEDGEDGSKPIDKEEAVHLDKQYAAAGVVWYPDTDKQYKEANHWKAAQDPSSGSTYYFNEQVDTLFTPFLSFLLLFFSL